MTLTQFNAWDYLALFISLLCFVSLPLVVFIVKFHKTNIVSSNVEKHQFLYEDIFSKLLWHVEDLFKELQNLERYLKIYWRWL